MLATYKITSVVITRASIDKHGNSAKTMGQIVFNPPTDDFIAIKTYYLF